MSLVSRITSVVTRIASEIKGKADKAHTHSISDINLLSEKLDSMQSQIDALSGSEPPHSTTADSTTVTADSTEYTMDSTP